MASKDFDMVRYYNLVEGKYTEEDIKEHYKNKKVELVGWYDHLSELPDTRVEEVLGYDEKGNEIVQHRRFDGQVFQEGTPVSAENLGQMEENDLINATNIADLQESMNTLQVRVATFLGGNANNMPYNQFVISAKDLRSEDTDLIILEGWYDEVNGRGVV